MILHVTFPDTQARTELRGRLAIFDPWGSQCSDMTDCTIVLKPHGFMLRELTVAIQDSTVICTAEVSAPIIKVFHGGKLVASVRHDALRLLVDDSIVFNGNQ